MPLVAHTAVSCSVDVSAGAGLDVNRTVLLCWRWQHCSPTNVTNLLTVRSPSSPTVENEGVLVCVCV